MSFLKTLATTLAIALPLGIASTAFADNKEKVQAFYDFLSNPGSSEHAAKFRENASSEWKSIGDYSGKYKTADVFIKQLAGFDQLIPDLEWEVAEMIEAGDRVIVRGKASGTPSGPFFGVDGKGKSFTIMSVDIHTVENGKIVKTYHVEDWAGALGQLRAK